MKLAIIGSRSLKIDNLEKYIPRDVTEIVSGGAKGIDKIAAEYARKKNIRLTEFLPDFKHYGRAAPLKRNEQIARYSDCALAFWDCKSKGTEYTINCFKRLNKSVMVIKIEAKTPFDA